MNDKLGNGTSQADESVAMIENVLEAYRQSHPQARIDVRRRGPVSIGIRVIDPDFQGVDWVDREPEIWSLLDSLPAEIISDITVLILLSPDETEASLANQEFEDPVTTLH
ncbi:MAG: hypothetical protein KY476_00185 [Planctomycetes bacterium]|nr:hypothetical protein [Planctomycetota bacterium]